VDPRRKRVVPEHDWNAERDHQQKEHRQQEDEESCSEYAKNRAISGEDPDEQQTNRNSHGNRYCEYSELDRIGSVVTNFVHADVSELVAAN
jgi:hypothetical protein